MARPIDTGNWMEEHSPTNSQQIILFKKKGNCRLISISTFIFFAAERLFTGYFKLLK